MSVLLDLFFWLLSKFFNLFIWLLVICFRLVLTIVVNIFFLVADLFEDLTFFVRYNIYRISLVLADFKLVHVIKPSREKLFSFFKFARPNFLSLYTAFLYSLVIKRAVLFVLFSTGVFTLISFDLNNETLLLCCMFFTLFFVYARVSKFLSDSIRVELEYFSVLVSKKFCLVLQFAEYQKELATFCSDSVLTCFFDLQSLFTKYASGRDFSDFNFFEAVLAHSAISSIYFYLEFENDLEVSEFLFWGEELDANLVESYAH